MLDVIEQAIIDKITAAKTSGAMAYLKTVDSYGGQLDGDLGEVIRSYPAIWVVFGGCGKPQKHGANLWKVPATFVLMYAARNVRNEKAARKGGLGEVGTYQMIEHGKVLLLNQDLGIEIEAFQPGAVRPLYNTKIRNDALSVISQEWTTAYVAKAPTVEEGDLLSVGMTYFLKPGDNVADASDLLTLEP
ncbi:MAG TPA: phage protein Gp37 [Methylophilaceae bacterium]|nr:phage protein Gp37 [Methylophilaceae bacterium]